MKSPIITPNGTTLWFTNEESSKTFTEYGYVGTQIVLDPTLPKVKEFIKKLQGIRDEHYTEWVKENKKLPASKKATSHTFAEVFTQQFNADDEETGMIIIKLKRKRSPKTPIARFNVLNGKNQAQPFDLKVGNGSCIKASVFVNGYAMVTNKIASIGVSLMLLDAMVWNLSTSTTAFEMEDDENYEEGMHEETETNVETNVEDY